MALSTIASSLLIFLPTALSATPCSDETCSLTSDSLLQTKTGTTASATVSEEKDSPWDLFDRYDDWTLTSLDGTTIPLRAEGYTGEDASDVTFDGTGPGCYYACMANPECRAFTFASPFWKIKTNRICYLHVQDGGTFFHRNDFLLGIPHDRKVDQSVDTPFFLQRQYETDGVTRCLAQEGTAFPVKACDDSDASQKWRKTADGVFVNHVTGQCIGVQFPDSAYYAQATVLAMDPETEPLVNCAKTYNGEAFTGNLYVEKLSMYMVPDAASQDAWDGTSMRIYYEMGAIGTNAAGVLTGGSGHVKKYEQVTELE